MARLNNLQRVRVLSHSLTSASWLFGVVLPALEVVEMDCAGITGIRQERCEVFSLAYELLFLSLIFYIFN
jgi:hypothetical protein